jgi:hypothetical protein
LFLRKKRQDCQENYRKSQKIVIKTSTPEHCFPKKQILDAQIDKSGFITLTPGRQNLEVRSSTTIEISGLHPHSLYRVSVKVDEKFLDKKFSDKKFWNKKFSDKNFLTVPFTIDLLFIH